MQLRFTHKTFCGKICQNPGPCLCTKPRSPQMLRCPTNSYIAGNHRLTGIVVFWAQGTSVETVIKLLHCKTITLEEFYGSPPPSTPFCVATGGILQIQSHFMVGETYALQYRVLFYSYTIYQQFQHVIASYHAILECI